MTDGQGRTVDFKNTIVIMTSNIGSQYIAEISEENMRQDRVMEALRLHFKPEFLNRVDDILIFQRLTKEQLREIVTLQMVRLKRLLEERHLTWNSPTRPGTSWPRSATTRSTGPDRCAGPSRPTCKTSWRLCSWPASSKKATPSSWTGIRTA